MSREKAKISNLSKFILGALLIIAISVWSAVAKAPDKNLHIYFLNVGQGDSIYVRDGSSFDLLVDGGPDNSVLAELGAAMPFYDKKIDLVVLTHPHADHVSGLVEVLKRYEVGEIWLTDATHTSGEYLEFLKTIQAKNIKTKLVKKGMNGEWGESGENGVKWEVLWPEDSYKNEKVDNLNNTSIILKLTYGDFSALFSGDAEEPVQSKLITYNLSPVTLLKIPHHGSSNAAYEPFIKAVVPKIAVIEVGENNKFGHPAVSTLKKYEAIGAKIFRTDRDGRVEIISDGKTYWFKAEK